MSGADSLQRSGWERVIDDFLLEWAAHPSVLDYEEIDTPSRDVLQRAISLARYFQQLGWPPPMRVVPTVDGGVSFERVDGALLQRITVENEDAIEFAVFRGTDLVNRERLA